MRVRVFTAPRMAEAMAMVRSELGADAVILGSRRTSGGVEVTAALEAPEPAAFAPAPPAAPVSPMAATLPIEAAAFAPPPAPPAPAAAPLQPAAAAPSATAGVLGRHGVTPKIAALLEGGPLSVVLAQVLAFRPLPDAAQRPLLLAGPCGAGKSLTCAKLAARAVLRGGGGVPPLVVTADGQRAGATEQLAAFARVLNAPLVSAPDPAAVAAAVARRAERQPVLIDTAGCDPFDPGQAAALLALARASGGAVVAVLPAGFDAQESADPARAFAVLGARHLLPTRLDAARRLGGVVSAAAEAGLALTEAGTGPGVADGLTPLSPEWLARRLEQGWSAPQPQQEVFP
jgi:flagellar biosynthesis protein FlhF